MDFALPFKCFYTLFLLEQLACVHVQIICVAGTFVQLMRKSTILSFEETHGEHGFKCVNRWFYI